MAELRGLVEDLGFTDVESLLQTGNLVFRGGTRTGVELERLLEGRTAIIIAHRLATLQRADRVMIIDEGSVVEHGDRATLATDSSTRFHALLETGLEDVLA